MVIVAAVDKTERASTILNQASTLAEEFDDSIHVVHVMKRSEAVDTETSSIRNDDAISLDQLEDIAASVAIDAIEEQFLSVETQGVGLIGDPADELIEYAEQQAARYIVVSPHRRSQTGKILFGSVAQSVLLNASCPVVSIIEQ